MGARVGNRPWLAAKGMSCPFCACGKNTTLGDVLSPLYTWVYDIIMMCLCFVVPWKGRRLDLEGKE